MRRVGIRRRMKAKRPVENVECPAVSAPTRWKIQSEAAPNTPIEISIAPNAANGRILGKEESRPPARLPSPSPSMNTVTIIVTDSMFTP